eukprot:CAMPEP_0194144774 /NCGR_PEP_ID=MMETSP0152-20130528/13785_1 /TAXON_ID=1049557 /ORGANISM="Thalassiothrix antarctica, Strain L6-D1" /LENGTH=127 /DNA_ID=CAMNT_0038844763 /DNA_START=124 /DNA_END=507 /DNA_ORIENTATION=-
MIITTACLVLLLSFFDGFTVVNAWTNNNIGSSTISRRDLWKQIQTKTTTAGILVASSSTFLAPSPCYATTTKKDNKRKKKNNDDEEKTIAEQAGEAVFLSYIGFSTLAGFKGIYDFIQKKKEEQQEA